MLTIQTDGQTHICVYYWLYYMVSDSYWVCLLSTLTWYIAYWVHFVPNKYVYPCTSKVHHVIILTNSSGTLPIASKSHTYSSISDIYSTSISDTIWTVFSDSNTVWNFIAYFITKFSIRVCYKYCIHPDYWVYPTTFVYLLESDSYWVLFMSESTLLGIFACWVYPIVCMPNRPLLIEYFVQ